MEKEDIKTYPTLNEMVDKISALLGRPSVSSEGFVTVDDDNFSTLQPLCYFAQARRAARCFTIVTHLRINDAQHYTVFIALAIPNSVVLQGIDEMLSCVYYCDTYERHEIEEQKHVTQSQKNTDFISNDGPNKEQKRYAAFLSRRESISASNEDRCLTVTPKRSSGSRASDLSRRLSASTGTTVSKQTLNRRLGHTDLYARRLLRGVPLKTTYCFQGLENVQCV
ncbi:hypothetical protein TNCV_55701 [Trichonephila clavipes]|nr:hypothetical protein TNCV_55701 [Trichonephila clavipes]